MLMHVLLRLPYARLFSQFVFDNYVHELEFAVERGEHPRDWTSVWEWTSVLSKKGMDKCMGMAPGKNVNAPPERSLGDL